jgi:hypothetical protein
MANEIERATSGGDLFAGLTSHDELRALVRTQRAPDVVARMSERELLEEARKITWALTHLRHAREVLERHIEQGRLTRALAEAMTEDDVLAYGHAATSANVLRTELDGTAARQSAEMSGRTGASEREDVLPAAQVIAVLGDLLALMHAQQAQIDELANDRDVFLARFADRMLERFRSLSESGRDFKGFEVTLDLEDEASQTRERSSNRGGEESGSSSSAKNTHAEMQVLAKQIGALSGGRNVNLDEMNRRVATLAASSRSEVRAKWSGKVTVKVGEVSGDAKGKSE